MGTTPDLDLEPALAEEIVHAALEKQLFTEAEVDAARASAEESGRSVVAVLVEEGLIAPRTVDALAASLADSRESGRTRAITAAPGGAPRPPASAPVVPGYQLLSKLGEGGMGAVWRARQVKVGGREVALKVISGSSAVSDDDRARFKREAQAAAAVSHENVISIFDVGETEDGRPFMALELVPGGDAQRLCETRGGRLHEAEALALVRDAARGVGALAKAGLVHRDIKPANIFIAADGRAKLADLGLARQAAGDDRMTASGMIVGTPAFMSPEQASAQPLDVRTDIYALGATLYALCTGRPPFVGRTALVVVAKVLNDEAPDPRDLAPALSAGTARVIARALAKDPRARFQTADELVEALQRALAASSGRVPREVPPPRPSGRVIAPTRRPSGQQTAPLPAASALRPAPARAAAPIALGLALALGVLGGAAALRGRSKTPPAPPVRPAPRASAPARPTAPTTAAPAPGPVITEPAALPEDTWTPAPRETPPAPRPPEPRVSQPDDALPATFRREGWTRQALRAAAPMGGRAKTDEEGRVCGSGARYLIGNSEPVAARQGFVGMRLVQGGPEEVWFSMRVNPGSARDLRALGDDTGTHAFAAQVRLRGSSGELRVWVLDRDRRATAEDYGLERERPVATIPLRNVNRLDNLLLYFSLGERWGVSLVQGETPLAQDGGELPPAAAAALSGERRVFTALCAHAYPRDERLLDGGIAFETR